MINKLNYFQNKYLTKESKRIIKSIESGLFTGIRNNNGDIKLNYIKHYNNNINKYNLVLNEIQKINKLFFKLHSEYINKPIILYRGLQNNINYKYNDYIPTSYSYNKKKAIDFILNDGTLLKYKCYDKNNLIINISNPELNEYEIILPPNKYNIVKHKITNYYLTYKNEKYSLNCNKYTIKKCD